MIKGINKMIIEVNDIKSDMFEKAVLFVRPDTKATGDTLKSEAERIIELYSEKGKVKCGFLRYTDTVARKRKAYLCLFTGLFLSVIISAVFIALKLL